MKIKLRIQKKEAISVLVIILAPGGFLVAIVWIIKVIYKKPVSILGIVNLIIEGLDSLPKIENPFKVFYDS
jgi:hypothetical protein